MAEWAPYRKSPWPVVTALVLAMAGTGCGDGGRHAAPTSSGAGNPAAQPAPAEHPTPSVPAIPTGRVGDVVHGGGLDVTVRKMQCGKTKLTDPTGILVWTPGGQYCLLTVNVKNVTSGTLQFRPDDQKVYTSRGGELRGQRLIGYARQDTIKNTLGPGAKTHGDLVFEILKEDRLLRVEIYEGALVDLVAAPPIAVIDLSS